MNEAKAYQLKIVLHNSKPPIWRRIVVDESTTLDDLHRIIQAIMGWKNIHLHGFDFASEHFTTPDFLDEETINENSETTIKISLDSLGLEIASRMLYTYDFFDQWKHVIIVEKIFNKDQNQIYPRCLNGQRASPPEDSGGIWSYNETMSIFINKNHPEHITNIGWLGKDFDPEAFDVDKTNDLLEEMFVN